MRGKVIFAAVCIAVIVVVLFLFQHGGKGLKMVKWYWNKPDINKVITRVDAMPSEHFAQVYGTLKVMDNFLVLESPGRNRHYLLVGDKIKELGGKYLKYDPPNIYVSGNLVLPKDLKIGKVKVAYALNVIDFDRTYYNVTRKGRVPKPENRDAEEMKKKLFAEINESDASLDVIRGRLASVECYHTDTKKKGDVLTLWTATEEKYILVDRTLPGKIQKATDKKMFNGAQVIITGRYSHPDPVLVVPMALMPQNMFEVKKIYNDTADKDEYNPPEAK